MSNKPRDISPELFEDWRRPIRGSENPTTMTNPVWTWAINSKLNAYQINEMFNGPDPADEGPGWCFDRFGMSTTHLADGRVVHVGGEHEDYYDPDFYIYNDVVVQQPSGEIEIYGYPTDDFPPTDFHSATLLSDQIFLIGNLGYPDDRLPGETQVLRVCTKTWNVARVETSGIGPGWIHDHKTRYSSQDGTLRISGGKVETAGDLPLIENIDEWQLDVSTLEWTRLTELPWCQFEIRHADRGPNKLWELRSTLFDKKAGWLKLPISNDLDKKLRILEDLYIPGVADDVLGQDEEDFRTYRIRVRETIVRYVEDSFGIQVTVEGKLPDSITQSLKDDLLEKYSALEGTDAECINLRG